MKQQEKEKEYETYVKEKTPVRKPGPAMAKAFVTGGIICTIGQTILNACEKAGMSKDISASWCSLILILASVVLTGFGIYPKIANWGGAGALVPITGFANSVAAPAIEYKKEGQVFGIGCKIFTIAGPVILYGVFTSWVLGLLYWIGTLIGIWSFRRMFHIRRGTCPCCNDCGGRLWRSGACCNIESFWKCRKRISFSTWLCESETTFFYLDSDRKRSLSGRKKEKPGADQWSDDWENCGLWAEGFTEYGSVYGTGSV